MSFLSTISHAAHDMADDGHKLISDAHSVFHTLEHDIENVPGDVKDLINSLKAKIVTLEDHILRSDLVAKTLHELVHTTEDVSKDFADDVKNAADTLWHDSKDLFEHLLKMIKDLTSNNLFAKLLELVTQFAHGTMNALITLKEKLEAAPGGIASWLSVDRFHRVWDDLKNIWADIVHLLDMVPLLIESGIKMEQTAQKWLTVPTVHQAAITVSAKQDLLSAATSFTSSIKSMASATNFADPGSLVVLDEANLELSGALKLVPDDFFTRAYHALRLDKVVEFFKKVVAFVESKSFKKDMHIAIAVAKSIEDWLDIIPDTLSVDGSGGLVDFIKGLFNAGDSSGTVAGGAGGSGGGGFNLDFKIFKGVELVKGALSLVIAVFTAVGTFIIDAIPA